MDELLNLLSSSKKVYLEGMLTREHLLNYSVGKPEVVEQLAALDAEADTFAIVRTYDGASTYIVACPSICLNPAPSEDTVLFWTNPKTVFVCGYLSRGASNRTPEDYEWRTNDKGFICLYDKRSKLANPLAFAVRDLTLEELEEGKFEYHVVLCKGPISCSAAVRLDTGEVSGKGYQFHPIRLRAVPPTRRK